MISLDEEQFKELKNTQEYSNRFILNQSKELYKLPQLSYFKVQHSDPKTAKLLASQPRNLMNQYGLNSEQYFYFWESLNY